VRAPERGPKKPTRRLRVGFTREVTILLPASLLLMLALSLFTLVSYGNALDWQVEERRSEAAEAAREAAMALTGGPVPRGDRGRLSVPEGGALSQVAPGALGIAVLDAGGAILGAAGDLPPGNLAAPLGGGRIRSSLGLGPGDGLPGRVAGFAPLPAPLSGPGGEWVVRVDLAAPLLAAELAKMRLLRIVVLGGNGAVLLLVLLFLRHLLAPYEELLARARRARGTGPDDGAEGDEVAFLLSTFEQALEALAERPEPAPGATGADAELRSLERALTTSLASGLLLLDRQGRLLAVNRVGAELLGIEDPEPGAPLARALSAHPELADRLAGAVARGEELRREECRVGNATLGITAHPLSRDDGGLRGYLILFADLTEVHRRERERRLADGLAQLGTMAAGAAHELRNSLATLMGYLTLAERRPGAEALPEYLAEMRRESEHLARVLDDFLTFARPETSRAEDVDLLALVRRAVADPALASGRVELIVEGEPEAFRGSLRGDSQLLERAIKNLLTNAVEAHQGAGSEAGGEPVRLRLLRHGDELEVAVEDRGPGLPAEVRERLFTPFVTGRPEGVGLGLALAHRIATLHGGRLTLEDRPEGGTRARLHLPVQPGEDDVISG